MIFELNGIFKAWLRWLRFQQIITWGLRGLLTGLVFSLIWSLLALSQAHLLREEFIALVVILSLVTLGIAAAASYFWPVNQMKAARDFDLVFHLGERVSTALELNQNEKDTSQEMVQRQLEDALTSARRVEPARALPLRVKTAEAVLVLILVGLIGLVWFRGENWFQASQQAQAVQQAVDEQIAIIEDILLDIENDNSLSEEQKKTLTQPLEEALSGLQENSSLEGSVSILTTTGEKLQALSDTQDMAQNLIHTGSQLASQEGSLLESVGQSMSEGNMLKAASELLNIDASSLSSDEAQGLASQLESMAQSLSSTNPQLASELNSAAEALQNGDTAAAQAALNQAAQSLAQASQQISFSQAAEQTAQQLHQGAGQILAAGGGQQLGQGGQALAGQGAGQNESSSESGGSGSGLGSAPDSPSTGSEAGSSPIPQNNGPGDGGETAYEQIYAPTLIGGEDGATVVLPGTGEDGSVIGQQPSMPSEPGQSLVPYSEVFSQYEAFNWQAIENSEIPVQFMPIIRNYFDSIKP